MNDKYYLDHCIATSKTSKCHTRQSGAVLVKNDDIICRGANGPAKGIPECSLRYKEDQLLLSIMSKNGIDPKTLKDTFAIKKCPGKVLNYVPLEGDEFCYSIHAIKNCLLEAASLGISTNGAKIYCNSIPAPCIECFLSCIQAGIKEIIVLENKIQESTLSWTLKYADIIVRDFNL